PLRSFPTRRSSDLPGAAAPADPDQGRGGRVSEPGSTSRDVARQVFEIEAQAILALRDGLDDSFERALALLFGCSGRVVVTGLGKSGLIGQKISATLSSTGTPSLFLHPVEALHGDLARIVNGDVA